MPNSSYICLEFHDRSTAFSIGGAIYEERGSIVVAGGALTNFRCVAPQNAPPLTKVQTRHWLCS